MSKRDQFTPPAEAIPFDNDTNGFVAEDVQTAIEEAATSGGGSDNNVDGGFANSVYLPDQCFDGGGA